MENAENKFDSHFSLVLKNINNTKNTKIQMTITVFEEHQNCVFHVFKNCSQ